MKTIMYRYIREFDSNIPNFKFLEMNDFKKQLDWFESEFGFITPDEFDKILVGDTSLVNSDKIILTFDDGFSDHYEYVYPELLKRGLWGFFYISTGPYSSHKVLDVHRTQLLCGQVYGKDLLAETLSLVSTDMIVDWKVQEFKHNRYTNQINLEGIREVKLILNYYINAEHKENIIDQLCSTFDIHLNADAYYLNINQIKNMTAKGMVFGSHTINHNVMSTLSFEEQMFEIQNSFGFIEQSSKQKYKTYCHPYGGPDSYNQATVDILAKNNVNFSFSVENREINSNDIKNQLQALPRLDCNQFPHGLSK